jgi:hypothetical protein
MIFLEPSESIATVSDYRAELRRCRRWHLVTATFTTPLPPGDLRIQDHPIAGFTRSMDPRYAGNGTLVPVVAGQCVVGSRSRALARSSAVGRSDGVGGYRGARGRGGRRPGGGGGAAADECGGEGVPADVGVLSWSRPVASAMWKIWLPAYLGRTRTWHTRAVTDTALPTVYADETHNTGENLLGLPVVSSEKTTDYLVTASRGRPLTRRLTWPLTCTDAVNRCFFAGNYREAWKLPGGH